MVDTSSTALMPAVLVLAASAAVLIAAGSRFTQVVDRLADRLGIGEAIAGALLLGATTSIPGLVVTTMAASANQPDLAASNALGGIAAQTAFLALADLTYRHANLEHAAASLPNLLQTMVLIALVSLVLLGATGPRFDAPIHPVTVLLPIVYVFGLVLSKRTRDVPMWRPRRTSQTRTDEPDPDAERESLMHLGLGFASLALVVSACGFAVAWAGIAVSERTGLSGTLVGGLATAIVTSLPELVTVLAAVRAGALTLAVADIVGGNTFDVLFVAVADAAYTPGPIYTAIGNETLFVLALTLLMTAIFAGGLIYRQRRGIGFEGVALLVVYVAGFGSIASC